MNDLKFPQFDDDVTITGIRHLFRYNDSSGWHVNITMYPTQEKSHLTMSNAPILARKRVLNPTNGHKTAGLPKTVTCSSVHDLSVKRVGNCPIPGYDRRADAKQFCFTFVSDDLVMVYLPQFELARALYFHDQYLSCTAMESDCLDIEFDVSFNGNEASISVMRSSGYSWEHLSNPASQRCLSWILLDPDVRSSYRSICMTQREKGEIFNNYRTWDFQFDPPPMRGVKLSVRGHYDRDVNCIFVYEIRSIRNLLAQLPETIHLHHPDFTTSTPRNGQGPTPVSTYSDGSYSIYDNAAAQLSSQQTIIHAPTVEIVFNKAFKVTPVSSREQKYRSYASDNEKEGGHIAVSTEEATSGHGLRKADWSTLEDVANDDHLFESKFDCFFSMVDTLVNTHGCTLVSKHARKLPSVPRCKKHLLTTDGSPRYIAIVELEIDGKSFHLLEVDTSDGEKALSTQLLSIQNPFTWETDFQRIAHELVRSSLNWPKDFLIKICGKGHFKGITHPHSPSGHIGLLDPKSIANWAARINDWTLSI